MTASHLFLRPLPRSFFEAPTLVVAQNLLGKWLVRVLPNKILIGEIREVEAYVSASDPAAHGFKGLTPRSSVMAASGGTAYVYQLYGHHCLNIVTEPCGVAAAVLIRAVQPVMGFDEFLSGPGKLCKQFQITLKENGIDLLESPELFVTEGLGGEPSFYRTSRIGISKATHLKWRFVMQD